jgi:hypothetical protein
MGLQWIEVKQVKKNQYLMIKIIKKLSILMIISFNTILWINNIKIIIK